MSEHADACFPFTHVQAGDTFDMSVILCSLLLGVGYNAYVVVGYAPQVSGDYHDLSWCCSVLLAEGMHAPGQSICAAVII